MTAPRFVIVGTGRHGSGYIAAVLNAAGIRCGHEQWWNPTGTHTDGLDGDSSWCATPFLDTYHGVVLHQVRDPLAVVTSLHRVPDAGVYATLRTNVVRSGAWLLDDPAEELDDPLTYAVASAVIFTRLASRHAVSDWRVENVAEVADDLARWIAQRAGLPNPTVEHTATTPTNTNAHTNGNDPLTWNDLPHNRWTDRLHDLARRHGYR